MTQGIPDETIRAFARTIHNEAERYGFSLVDTIRLINALMDLSTEHEEPNGSEKSNGHHTDWAIGSIDEFPITSTRLRIRQADRRADEALLESWMEDEYGRHFLLSCATAQVPTIRTLLSCRFNQVGIVELRDESPIGAVAFLDIDRIQRRAELRKVIGVKNARGQGFAEEAAALWIEYGRSQLGLEKIYVSTLQTHIRNIKLNEAVGFQVEGILRSEVRLGDQRHDVLRMGFCAKRA